MRQFLVLKDYSFSLNGIDTISVKKDEILNAPDPAILEILGDRVEEFHLEDEPTGEPAPTEPAAPMIPGI